MIYLKSHKDLLFVKKNRIAIDKDYYEFIVKLLQKKWYFLWAQKNIINMKIHIWIMIHVVHRFYNIKNMKTKSIFRKIVAKLKSGGGKSILEEETWNGRRKLV